MYGTFSGMSFGLVALAALMVIALAVLASPLLAVAIAAVAAVFLLIGMSALRQRSARQDRSEGGAPDTHSGGPGARGTHGGAATGSPASGEG
jgi:membrane protein implicated in regulation of membrane protease activity